MIGYLDHKPAVHNTVEREREREREMRERVERERERERERELWLIGYLDQ